MEFFLLNSLGAFGTNLSLLANFFESPWLKANAGLDKKTQGWIIGTSGFALRAVGRLAEAVETIETGFEAAIQANDNVSAARDLNNLSDLNLTLGNIDKAIEVGMRSIRISDECADPLLPIINRARTAYALLQSGATIQARLLFEEAGTLIKNAPNPFSLSVISDYNELLLDDQNRTKVLQRAEESLKTATTLLHVALGHLFLGRAHSSGSQESAFHLEQAVAGFRRANQLDELPRGLLARARNHRFSGDLQKAQHDLDEVRILSARCGMRLYLSDYHLEQAELFLSQCELAAARSHCESAHRMVQEAGYHRRDPAVAHLAFALQKSQSR